MNYYPFYAIDPGTLLYHGTKCDGDFGIPDGPAWFCFSLEKGHEWIDWASTVPSNRREGRKRTLVVQVNKPIILLDTQNEKDWRLLCERMTDDPECSMYAAADAARRFGLVGWYGSTEIMLVQPSLYVSAHGEIPKEEDNQQVWATGWIENRTL